MPGSIQKSYNFLQTSSQDAAEQSTLEDRLRGLPRRPPQLRLPDNTKNTYRSARAGNYRITIVLAAIAVHYSDAWNRRGALRHTGFTWRIMKLWRWAPESPRGLSWLGTDSLAQQNHDNSQKDLT